MEFKTENLKENYCALCGIYTILQESHIIPKFATRWIKETSLTGKLLNSDIPTLRAQDGHKQYLLCKECEGLFNKRETKFVNKVFKPFKEQQKETFEYEEWMEYFITSVQWRALVVLMKIRERKGIKTNVINSHLLVSAVENMHSYLLGKNELHPYIKHHFIIPQPISFLPIAEFLPVEFINRSTMFQIFDGDNYLYIFSNIAGIFLVTVLTEYHGNQMPPDKWLLTQVLKQGTTKALSFPPPSVLLMVQLSNIIIAEQSRTDYSIVKKTETSNISTLDKIVPKNRIFQKDIMSSYVNQLALQMFKEKLGLPKLYKPEVAFESILSRAAARDLYPNKD